MAKIETIRHSLAHILASAVQELYPGTKFGIGPAIENGFYYDFEFNLSNEKRIGSNESRITEEMLPKVEKKMRELMKKNITFKKRNLHRSDLCKLFEKQPYKMELINELKGNELTIYESGDFIDLCK